MTTTSFPARRSELIKRLGALRRTTPDTVPSTMRAFAELHRAAMADGALSRSTKELIALAIGITSHCDGCIAFHVHDALDAGATPDEIADAIAVAIQMGGGPAAMYGADAYHALEQFTAEAR